MLKDKIEKKNQLNQRHEKYTRVYLVNPPNP
jgi:hypothetical protein